MKLVETFDELLATWRPHFAQARTFERGRALAFSSLVTWGRHTVTRLICSQNKQGRDWSADYRFYSKREWNVDPLFFEILKAGDSHAHWPQKDVLVALDDTARRKTGKKIPGVRTLRDPMSLPYHVNLIPGIRYLQGSLLVNPNQGFDYFRAIPVLFEEAAPAKKPRKNASPEDHASFKEEQKKKRISIQGHQAVLKLRKQIDDLSQGRERRLIVTVDGSFCNKSFLRALPDNVIPIARARKDLKLFKPAEHSMRANRVYGERLPTPQEIRQDDAYPWQQTKVFFAGADRDIRYKAVAPVLWQSLGEQPCRLIIIAPLGYRLHKGAKKLYREPVYLITCDLDTPVEQVLQYYFLRWDIEVNHRDEKSLLGVGDAQVRAPLSVTRNPQFAVALYALLLLASIRAYGATRTDDYLPLPKWRRVNDRRPSTLDILAQFRREVMAAQLTSEARHNREANSAREKFLPATESTDFVITLPASSSKVDLPVSIIAALLYAEA
jgi:DDE superfamily endonuclease